MMRELPRERNCPAHTMRVDITSLTEKDRQIIKIANPEIDLLFGGPPCQGFSVGGHQNEDDPRNNLVFEYVKFLELLTPKYFIFENVPGLLSAKFDNIRNLLLNDFQSLGYQLDSKLIFAADYVQHYEQGVS
jgi:DNA (cytosine-5)-methyltransferase 1